MQYMYVVNEEIENAVSAVKKMAKRGKPGAFVMLSPDEFKAVTQGWIHPVPIGDKIEKE